MNLRIPGPTPVPESVLQAMTKQMVNHRGKEFGELVQRITERLQGFFQTKGDVLILTASGTGSMEAAVTNTLSPGDEALAITNGSFGDRFAKIAEVFGAKVQRLSFEWGQPVEPEAVRRALAANPRLKAVLLVHNETSTGVTNDLKAIAAIVRQHDKLFLVDAISSIGCIPLPVDEWGCDVVLSGSQKGWMAPPGLAFVSFNQRAWAAYKEAKMPRFYFDLGRAKTLLEKRQTPWTPAVSTFYALGASLELMANEGLEHIHQRHARVAQRARDGVRSLGLKLLAAESCASHTVTAVYAPPGVDPLTLRRTLLAEYKIDLAEGQEKLADKIFRIGHLGFVTEADIDKVTVALREALPRLGYRPAASAIPKS